MRDARRERANERKTTFLFSLPSGSVVLISKLLFFPSSLQWNCRTKKKEKEKKKKLNNEWVKEGGGIEKAQDEKEKYFPIWHKYRKVFIIRVICGNFFFHSLSLSPFVENHIHFCGHVILRISLLKRKTSRYFSCKPFFFSSIFLIKCTVRLKCLCFYFCLFVEEMKTKAQTSFGTAVFDLICKCASVMCTQCRCVQSMFMHIKLKVAFHSCCRQECIY